ncbi:MAG: glycosyl hydrolase [Anaerolineae bacterium]
MRTHTLVGRRLAVALVFLALTLVPQAALAADPRSPSDIDPPPLAAVTQADPFFGVVQAVSAPDKAQAAGVRWERLVYSWSTLQPLQPTDVLVERNFPPETVQADKARGIEVVGVVVDTPQWAVADHRQGPRGVPKGLDKPWNDPENYFGNFMYRLAGLYKGSVDTWIIWNEPDVYDSNGHAFWEGTPAEYARLLKVGYQAVKAANPKARVNMAGMAFWFDKEARRPLFMQDVLAALAKDPEAAANNWFFDGIMVHAYGNPLNAYAEPMLYRRVLAAYGLDKPIWIGEANVVPYDDPAGKLERNYQRASLQEQAAWVIQATALARAAGVERFEVYKMRDEGSDNGVHWGLVRDDGSVRPAYLAYQTAAQQFGGATNATLFWGGSTFPPSNAQTQAVLSSANDRWQFIWPSRLVGVRMQRGDSLVTVVWNTSPQPLSVFIPTDKPVSAVDRLGKPVTLGQTAGGYKLDLAPATHNTDSRDPTIYMIGGAPVILTQAGESADAGLPREVDACFGAPGLGQAGWKSETGYTVSGAWLDFYQANGGLSIFGYPRSSVMVDPLDDRQCVQYFQRAVLEWHPENPPPFRIQRRLLTEILTEAAAPATPADGPNTEDRWYFPKGPQGLGHAVSNVAADGTRTGFKSFFDRYGRETTFGYPMEEPTKRGDLWTQRFQAGIMEYHPEFDKDGLKPGTDQPWRTWTVELRLLGDEYIQKAGLPFAQ